MSDYQLIRAEHDETAGVYRLWIGRPVVGEVPVLDEYGKPLMEQVPAPDADGRALPSYHWEVSEDEDEPPSLVADTMMVTRPVMREEITGHEGVLEFVFADDDERWFIDEAGLAIRRPDEEVVAEQVQTIAAHLAQQETQAAASQPRALPGAGMSL
jgi:hypothetical protein